MKRNNLDFYDQQASCWWDENAIIAPLSRLNPMRFEYFDRTVAGWQGLRVLDVGCGGGFTCEFLARRGAQVWGIDQSVPCIAAAKLHAEQANLPITYCHGVAETLPMATDWFDVVVCVDVLEHVTDPLRTMSEIGRVLKPGGLFCFDTINRTLRSRLIMIWLLEIGLRQIPVGIHDWRKFITPAELCHMMAQAGLSPMDISGFNFLGSTLAENLRAYQRYQATGKFQARFDDDTRVMYIGTAMKAGIDR